MHISLCVFIFSATDASDCHIFCITKSNPIANSSFNFQLNSSPAKKYGRKKNSDRIKAICIFYESRVNACSVTPFLYLNLSESVFIDNYCRPNYYLKLISPLKSLAIKLKIIVKNLTNEANLVSVVGFSVERVINS